MDFVYAIQVGALACRVTNLIYGSLCSGCWKVGILKQAPPGDNACARPRSLISRKQKQEIPPTPKAPPYPICSFPLSNLPVTLPVCFRKPLRVDFDYGLGRGRASKSGASWDPYVFSEMRVGIRMSSATCGLGSLCPHRHAG